jgi:HNH endonuclease
VSHHIRAAAFVPAPVIGICGWAWLAEPGAATGFAVAVALGLLLWPLLILAAVFFAPSCLSAALPRRWRIRWRKTHERQNMPTWLRRAVLAADRYTCVFCGHRAGLQIDHIRPWASGGLTSLFNLMVLCGPCNRVKSNYWRDRDGYVHYRSFPGSGNEQRAAAILAVERRHRLNLLRWLRAAWSLG